jgi:hypothetical protein
MAHDEFPPLTRSGIEVLQHANTANYENYSGPGGVRPFAAAVIRETVKQSTPYSHGHQRMQVVRVADLLAIADNLHALPPPPPTREQMEAALNRLWPLLDCQPGSKGDEYMQILRRGIAHHCKEQP